MVKAYEYLALLVPETKSERLEARQQRDRLDCLEVGIGVMTSFEMVVRNARTQVMNMMEADIAGEPLQEFGQFVKRAALERRRGVIPILGARPVSALELVLHIEEPKADGSGKSRHGELDQ